MESLLLHLVSLVVIQVYTNNRNVFIAFKTRLFNVFLL